mmetsp:Transcript_12218/g.28477  ORF Transcript_12218/g.28477 Transcript_12218/m.28477 type:complete len:194 (-) Transcript_12218:206-787(-)|eukprot:CAMPEP_0178431146 /NCGR_PEP_ID=MMETSP0689_2-20121128/31687_1 /TAXON_ID=160604 /ORGANISM="Amphidinium massartii, Strain CS-259" /LENGTH=193 /DNA_ID=CAMNT_0020053029 /DNA_START=78 /DNA_END=659 /DNA_ORIENTATION=+
MAGRWVFPTETSWVIHEKRMSFTGDDFHIEDEQGNIVARADGSVMSMRDRKKFVDARTGEEIFTTRMMMMSMTPTAIIEREGQVLATIRSDHCGCPPTYRCYQGMADFSWGNETDAPVLYECEAAHCCRGRTRNFLNGNGDQVATSHEERCNDMCCGTDEYVVECDPGVHCAFIWAITIAIDDIIEAQQRNSN